MARQRRLPLPDNADGLWRRYYGVRLYHHYNANQLRSAWEHQVADCGRESRTGNGSYSTLQSDDAAFQSVCARCRQHVDAKTVTTVQHTGEDTPTPGRG